MNRTEWAQWILATYAAKAEHLWQKHPSFEVFRHCSNQKWLAVIMTLEKTRLGLQEKGTIDVINLKCNPVLVGSLRMQPGFFPAYHMNKENWITVALNGTVPEKEIKELLDMSARATAPKGRRTRQGKENKNDAGETEGL